MNILEVKNGSVVHSRDNNLFSYVVTRVGKHSVNIRVNTKDPLHMYNYCVNPDVLYYKNKGLNHVSQ